MAIPKHVLYVAPLLAFGLFCLYCYRRLMQYIERCLLGTREPDGDSLSQQLLPQPWNTASRVLEAVLAAAQYYTPMYVVCARVVYDEFQSSFKLLLDTDFLDPAKLREAFDGEAPLPAWWHDELKTMLGGPEDWGLLRRFTLLSPLFLVLTFLVSIGNTCRHAWRAFSLGGGLGSNPGVDSTIMIIALPMISCMMAYRSVTRMWMITANSKVGSLGYIKDLQGNSTWDARVVVCQNYYDTNMLLADLYESWALLHFARLALQVIDVEAVKQGWRGHDLLGGRFTSSIKALTNQGIYLFNFTCFLQASYHLATTTIEAYQLLGEQTVRFDAKVYSMRGKVHFFFLGMGAIASTAAIGNVVTIEQTFEEQLRQFRPFMKFWSTKILLSIGFIQSLLLEVPPFSYLSVTEKDLLYSSLLCAECFGVSIIHYKAWTPKESWYDDLRSAVTDPEQRTM